MSTTRRIALIGAGNVSWHLGPALENAGHVVQEVFSQSKKNASELVNRLYQAEVKTDLNFAESKADLFIIAVPDDVISLIAQDIALPDDCIIVHTSGAKSLGVLGYTATESTGVLYPLQTFTKSKKVEFKDIPICVEAGDKKTEKILINVAKSITKSTHVINSDDRKALHVAAVFACNFTNHFLSLAESILQSKGLNFDVLQPLITETIHKAITLGPSNAQTGPAKRHDFLTLDQHMEFLSANEELAELYRLISQNIVDQYPLE